MHLDQQRAHMIHSYDRGPTGGPTEQGLLGVSPNAMESADHSNPSESSNAAVQEKNY